jgi:hypothetical protein
MISQHHAVMMHGIAQLTFFGNGLLIIRSLMRMIFYQVLVSIYHYLPGRKTDQDDPCVNDMKLNSFQNSNDKLSSIIVPFRKNSQTML